MRALLLLALLAFGVHSPVAAQEEPAEQPANAEEDASAEEEELFPEDGDLDELLESEEDLEIPDVIVRAPPTPVRRTETGGAVQRLDEEILERYNYDDPHSVFAQVPSVYVRQEDGYGLRPNIGLRGVSAERSTRITLLEDGVLFAPAAYAAPAAYYFPLMTRMTGVDVYLGAAAIPYGPRTVGGAINLRSREIPREPAGGVDVAFGTTYYSRAHVHYGASNEWGGVLVEGVYLRSDGFKHIGQPGEPPDEDTNTGFDRGELVLRGELRGALAPDVYARAELRLGLSAEVSNETYLGLTDEDFRADPYLRYEATRLDRMEWWRTQVQLRTFLEWGDDFELSVIAYRHDLDRSWNKVNAMGGLPSDTGQERLELYDILINPSGRNAVYLSILQGTGETDLTPGTNPDQHVLIGTNARRFGVTGIQADAIGRFETAPISHQIRGGVRVHDDEVTRVHTEDAYAMIGGVLVPQTETYTTLRSDAEAIATSAYLSWALRWETLTLTPGVRTKLIVTRYFEEELGRSREFRPAILPGGSIEWAIIPELAVFGGIMRGFAPVAPGQAAHVQPEDSITYELGARLTSTATRTSGQITAFANDYSNFLQVCSFAAGCADAAVDVMDNGGAAIIAGFDAHISQELRVGDIAFPLRATYTFTYTELRSEIPTSAHPSFAGAEPGDHLPYVPEHLVSAQVGMEMREFGIDVSASFVSEMWEAAARGDEANPPPRTDPLFLLDATAYLQIFEGMRLYLRGENLTNSQAIVSRRPFGARPNRAFSIQGGVRVAF